MSITSSQRKQYKVLAHHLQPIVAVAGNGLTEGVIKELNRALSDHELIKVKVNLTSREERAELIEEMTRQTQSVLVNSIGKTAILLRRNPTPNPKLSNLIRGQMAK